MKKKILLRQCVNMNGRLTGKLFSVNQGMGNLYIFLFANGKHGKLI